MKDTKQSVAWRKYVSTCYEGPKAEKEYVKVNEHEDSFEISGEQAQRIIDSACPEWKSKLVSLWAEGILVEKRVVVDKHRYSLMREACTQEQHELFDEIFEPRVKTSEPLFITSDGGEVFLGDVFFVVNTYSLLLYPQFEAQSHHDQNSFSGTLKTFSEERAAKEYIFLNTCAISLQDVINEFTHNCGEDKDFVKSFREIVESRLKS